MAEMVFFSGTMDCGKSTLALQVDYNHRARGRSGLLFSSRDRAGDATISSRLGLRTDALEVTADTDFRECVLRQRGSGAQVDYLICDEAQFYTARQIEQLALVVDELEIDVFAFGITTDFRTRLFPGAQRLMELADRIQVLQVEALCWCGRRATHNARTVDGVMVLDGEQVVVGNIEAPGKESDPQQQRLSGAGLGNLEPSGPVVSYETLCRRHHMKCMTTPRAGTQPHGPAPMQPYT
jgi:thymidine kinase